MADITVTCTNDKNVSIAFRWDWDNNPFHLLGLDGIYGYDCNVTTSENTTTDGSTYQLRRCISGDRAIRSDKNSRSDKIGRIRRQNPIF